MNAQFAKQCTDDSNILAKAIAENICELIIKGILDNSVRGHSYVKFNFNTYHTKYGMFTQFTKKNKVKIKKIVVAFLEKNDYTLTYPLERDDSIVTIQWGKTKKKKENYLS